MWSPRSATTLCRQYSPRSTAFSYRNYGLPSPIAAIHNTKRKRGTRTTVQCSSAARYRTSRSILNLATGQLPGNSGILSLLLPVDNLTGRIIDLHVSHASPPRGAGRLSEPVATEEPPLIVPPGPQLVLSLPGHPLFSGALLLVLLHVPRAARHLQQPAHQSRASNASQHVSATLWAKFSKTCKHACTRYLTSTPKTTVTVFDW